MTADTAWETLNASLQGYAPPCDGLELFTTDCLTDDERAMCASVCARCPITDPCDAYATAAKVDSGFWAGADRSSKRKRVTATKSTTEPGGSPGNQWKETP